MEKEKEARFAISSDLLAAWIYFTEAGPFPAFSSVSDRCRLPFEQGVGFYMPFACGVLQQS